MKRKRVRQKLPVIILVIILLGTIIYGYMFFTKDARMIKKLRETDMPDYVTVDLLDLLTTSRSGRSLEAVNGIVIHYVGNPNTTAMQNRSYFANPTTEVNSHFVIGLDGEVLQCVPIYERSIASNNRNKDTISIEVCHPDASGKFNQKTYDSLVKLTAYLCDICDLDENDVIRHYDITGKKCPLYYVDNPDDWEQLKIDIKNAKNRG